MENILFVVGCVFILLGLVFSILALYTKSINRKLVNSWITVPGVISQSSVSEIDETITASIDDFENSDLKTIKLNVQYQYTYKSKEYNNSNIYALKINNLFLNDNSKKKIHQKLSPNKKIEVYINPLEPNQSAIFKEISLIDKIIPSIVFLSIGLIFIIYNFIG